jgi:hypothetical protein
LNILEKIKYTYMFIYLLILISGFILVSLKITGYVLPLLNEHEYSYRNKINSKIILKQCLKTLPYFLLGAVITMGIFSLLDNEMLIKLANANI